jgi:hypothetical protein
MVALEDDSPMMQPIASQDNGVAGPFDQSLVEEVSDAKFETTPADVDEMVESAVALEQIWTSLSKSPLTHPMSASSAAAIEAAVAHIRSRVGMPVERTIAVEQFSLGRPARIQAIRVAMESIGETIKKLVAQIIAWIKKTMSHAFTLLGDAFTGAGVYAKKAAQLEKMAMDVKAIHGNVRPNDTFQDEGFVKFFSGHKNAAEIFRDFKRYNDEFNTHFSADVLGKAGSYLSNIANEVLKTNSTGDFSNQAAAEAADKAIRWLKDNAFKLFKDDGENSYYPLPFGAKSFVVNYTKHEDTYIGMTINTVSGTPAAGTVPVLTAEEVIGLAKGMDLNSRRGLFRDFPQVKRTLGEINSTVAKACEEIARQQAINSSGAVASLHFLKLIAESLIKLTVYAYQYNTMVNKQIVAYGHASLKQYKVEAKAPELKTTPENKEEPTS